MSRPGAALATAVLLVAGCSTAPDPPRDPAPAPEPGRTSAPAPVLPGPTLARTPLVAPDDLRVGVAVATVSHLAGTVGPRHATSPAYRRSAAWVAGRLRELGYTVRRQGFTAPGGDSWGVAVGPGRSLNVVAHAPDVDPGEPHLVVGAHLDTVPASPGAEDNASGVGVLLAVAEALQDRRSRLPVVLVAFGAEEPRGPTDADHHYGSRAYVASLDGVGRRAVRGMVSLDRVGVGDALGRVPVCSALDPPGQDPAQARVLRAADRAGVLATACLNRSSDHWSFVREGLPGVRIGSTPYAEYHAAGDLPRVVARAQLSRVGWVVLAWLAGGR